MRLFVAAYPPAEVLDDLESTVRGLAVAKAIAEGTNTRLISRPLWHITLAFLGEVADSRVVDATRALDRAADHLTGVQPGLAFSGGGRFGRGRFTILWAGLTGDTPILATIARAVHAELRHSRLPHDPKPFQPHLTLARPGDRIPRSQIDEDIATLANYTGPTWTCTDLTLVSSHLGPHPQHVPIHVAPLT